MLRTSTLLVTITLASTSFAQTPLLDASAQWDEKGGYFSAPTSGITTFSYHLDGDTLINGQTYYKVQRTGVDSVYMMVPMPPYTQFMGANSMDAYMGALREDAVQRKWYMVFNGQSTEQLLYDFDLVVGSSISGTFGDCGSGPSVTYIDQVMIDGTSRNRYHLTFGYLIEGVGANTGLFGYLCQFFESGNCLEVFHQDGDTFVVDGCSPLTTSVSDLQANTGFDIGPNPATTILNIVPVDDAAYEIILLDARGRIALRERAQGRRSVDVSTLASGPYVAQLRSRDQVTMRKLVIAQH